MAAIQASAVQNVNPFLVRIFGEPMVLGAETLLTDASRTVPLAQYTIMAQIASTRKWVPWINANLGDTTGMQYPLGILMSDGGVTAAALAAGDVLNQQILVGGGVLVDGTQIVFDGGSTGVGTLNTLNSVPTVPTNLALTAQRILELHGIYVQGTVTFDAPEN